MSAHVVVTLDTTAPDLTVDASQDVGDPTLLTFTLASDADVSQVRVWGGIDPIDPINSDYGETQGAATWIDYAEELVVRAAAGGAPIYVQVRDDVWNESESVLASGTVVVPPTEPPTTRPGVPHGPARRRVVARREVHTAPSRVRIRTATTVSATSRRVRTRTRLGTSSRTRHVATMSHRRDIHVHAATAVRRSNLRSQTAFEVASETAIHRRPEGPNTEATLLDLDII